MGDMFLKGWGVQGTDLDIQGAGVETRTPWKKDSS